MKILVLGSGGREHAICWKLKQSPLLQRLVIAPGNAGTASLGKNSDVNPGDFGAVKKLVLEENIDMVIVGPEDPLVNGIHDFFLNDPDLQGIHVIGPKKEAARLEGSKDFAKDFMNRHHIPTAAHSSFTINTLEEGKAYLETQKSPYVLKADGLAAGKGVLIIHDLQEAKEELSAMLLDAKFGQASTTVVVEEFLSGIELSCFVLTDGDDYKILPFAKDYKRIGEGDTGLNTGGMGAISPVPFVDEAFEEKIRTRIVQPTIEGLKKDGIPYKGFIFIGLIKVDSDPYVIEYNVRLGDPETEVVLPRIKSDLLQLLQSLAEGNLEKESLETDDRFACTVMAVSGGYPGSYEKGKPISGLDKIEDSIVFHAGTRILEDEIVTNGGRVMAFTSIGVGLNEALSTSYDNLARVQFDGMNYRKDIGFDL
ncbi:MAG: phosphoribosylamine--glycine ligase [Flavobacteriaceae bacterium]